MFSKLLNSTLKKLSIQDSASSSSPESSYPTLFFPSPPPAGAGTGSVCARCLTLVSHMITQYGDGTGYEALEIFHSGSMLDPPLACIICIKTLVLWNAMKAHVSFENSWRTSPAKDWSLTWNTRMSVGDAEKYPQFAFPHHSMAILMNVKHKGGYGWGIGGFEIYPDGSVVDTKAAREKATASDLPIIRPLDESEYPIRPEHDFSSTLSIGVIQSMLSWAHDCGTSHSKCQRVFGTKRFGEAEEAWFPDRLIHIKRSELPDDSNFDDSMVDITARIVLKSNSNDFPPDKLAGGFNYLSLSHCWGPSPNPSAPLGGRAGTVLTESNLSAWRDDLPLDDLPLTFQHAVMVSACLGFEYIWIDSLCILQDSLEDWQTQSAVMGDVYKFAWLNIAALSSTSDSQGFINESRDPRIEFGFRAPFSSILGRADGEQNPNGQDCILLHGNARLLWNYSNDIPGSTSSNAPLFKRAWVYQERALARRTLAFTNNGVSWACDESSRAERQDWTAGSLTNDGLRGLLHSVLNTATMLAAPRGENDDSGARSVMAKRKGLELLKAFDWHWTSTVNAYTLCSLTKHTDKLIAVSSVARELANTKLVNKRYLAGLWDFNLPYQMAWINVEGEKTAPRKRVGDSEYVAPSWSWASIESCVQTRSIFNTSNDLIALIDVHAADVALQTDYAFGSVKAGWMRAAGRLNRVKAGERKQRYSWDKESKNTSLTDEVTGEKLWFCSDTVEGIELVERGRDVKKLVWMPLTLAFRSNMLDCTCMVLIEEESWDTVGIEHDFVKQGDRVFRRLGTGNFGRIPSMLRQDKLLLELGTYPDAQVDSQQGQRLATGFKRKEEDFVEFVLI